MEKFVEEINMENIEKTYLVRDGSVDSRGQTADKRNTGGWKAAPFIIVNEMAERLAFFAIALNLVSYLVLQMHQAIPEAVTHVTNWTGAAFFLTILGAFLADSYLGRFKTIIIFSCIYSIGMVLLTLSASIDSLHPPKCVALPCIPSTDKQTTFLNVALALIAIGTGGIKPCVSSFGADQFDDSDEKELPSKSAFFSWFYLAINIGALFALTLLMYLQEKKGWVWGFSVPTAFILLSIFIIIFGMRYYRFQRPTGSAFTRFLQVIVASVRNHFSGVQVKDNSELYEVMTVHSDIKGARKLSHTTQYKFLDKAAVITNPEASTKNRWRLCTVTQIEEFKSFVRVLPVWLSSIVLAISFAQVSTFFITQAATMDRSLGPNFVIPLGSVPIFTTINAIIVVPIYEKIMVPFLSKRTGHRRGITTLQRIGVSLFFTIIGMVSAALVEKKRLGNPNPAQMSVFWLFPQFFIMGTAEVFGFVGMYEFFYNEATDGTRSISSALFLTEVGVGNWLSTAVVKIVERATGGEEKGWIRKSLKQSRLDYFYWLLVAIDVVGFFVYLWVAKRYRGRSNATVVDVELVEKESGLARNERS